MKSKNFNILNKKKNIIKGDIFRAGIGIVDITPTPGIPLSGHSMHAGYARGVRTKLKARIVCFKSANGEAVSLVSVDLLSGSKILHHRIAELIADKTDIEASGLMLSGTHTHSGPGNFYGSNFYNDFAGSNSGFDDRLYNFLAEKISSEIINIWNNMKEAMIAFGSREIWNVTRNRSIEAYNLNQGKADIDIFKAINPMLYMIRIDLKDKDGVFKPAGAFTSFSMHPNIGNKDLGYIYNGDTTAYTEREVERGIKRKYDIPWEPVHAVVNLTHGDCTPNFRKDVDLGFIEDRRIGQLVGQEAMKLFNQLEDSLKSDIDISYSAKEVDFFTDGSLDQCFLAKNPRVGCALTAGAQDRGRSTPILNSMPLFAPGWPKKYFKSPDHGHKRVLLGPLQSLILKKKDFPHNIFMQSIQVGKFLFLPLPFEITYESGIRISNEVKLITEKYGKKGVESFIPISCSNGYTGYITTPEEYSRQHYEGGHTLYGSETLNFISKHMGLLVKEMRSGVKNLLPDSWEFNLKVKRYFKEKNEVRVEKKLVKNPVFYAGKGKMEPYWSMKIQDIDPGNIRLDQPYVSIEVKNGDASWKRLKINDIPVDDEGYDISIIYKKKMNRNSGVYELQWHNPVNEKDFSYRFAVESRMGNAILYSKEF